MTASNPQLCNTKCPQSLCITESSAARSLPHPPETATVNVVSAECMGMCFGVSRALEIARRVDRPESVTVLGELVHNEAVQAELCSRGFHVCREVDRKLVPATPRVLITAHGISDLRRRRLRAAGKRLIDTTCPLVRRVQQRARRLEADGRHVLVVGRPRHVEVQGIVEDLSHYDVIPDVAAVRAYPANRLTIVCQTTVPLPLAEEIHLAVRLRNLRTDVRFEDTTCAATRDRQAALRRLLPAVDAMVVVGGCNSNNTRELVALCRRQGVETFHVQSADELDAARLHNLRNVGLTAGTSTLQQTIREVREVLRAIPTAKPCSSR